MEKKALIKCVDGILYTGIVEMNNDIALILKEVECNNKPNDIIANVGICLAGEVTFMWNQIIWITYKED